jgi:hypothetical protein
MNSTKKVAVKLQPKHQNEMQKDNSRRNNELYGHQPSYVPVDFKKPDIEKYKH